MGAADFNTAVSIQGTREEVLAILKIIRAYATEKREQYRAKRNCPYLTHVNISGKDETSVHKSMLNMSDEELLIFIEESNCSVFVEAGGPYGVYMGLQQLSLFHEMAEAAPNAQFQGGMGGFDAGGDSMASFELNEQKLLCKYACHETEFYEDEDFEDDWDEEDCEQEPDWDTEIIYDPILKKNVRN